MTTRAGQEAGHDPCSDGQSSHATFTRHSGDQPKGWTLSKGSMAPDDCVLDAKSHLGGENTNNLGVVFSLHALQRSTKQTTKA